MKPIIFVRISSMKYYKGITNNDRPENGGSYVTETGDAHECYNFDAVNFEDGTSQCLGFTMLTGKRGSESQIKIENIVGCDSIKNEEKVEGVTVIWCAKARNSQNIELLGFTKMQPYTDILTELKLITSSIQKMFLKKRLSLLFIMSLYTEII